jgi:hypothetical protein
MNITYEFGEFNGEEFIFRLSDKRWIGIDLAKYFPTYKLPYNNLADDKWHFTAQDSNDIIKKGDVKLFDKDYVIGINRLCKSFYNNNILFKKTTQIELDRYESKLEPITDNGKLYNYIMELVQKDIEEKSSIRTTLII